MLHHPFLGNCIHAFDEPDNLVAAATAARAGGNIVGVVRADVRTIGTALTITSYLLYSREPATAGRIWPNPKASGAHSWA